MHNLGIVCSLLIDMGYEVEYIESLSPDQVLDIFNEEMAKLQPYLGC
jgi:hypothetical protein